MFDSRDLTLLQINDSHAYLEPHNEYFWNGEEIVIREAGGYARIAGLVKSIRDEKENEVLFLDNGDTIHGTYPAVTTQGIPEKYGAERRDLDINAIDALIELLEDTDRIDSSLRNTIVAI
ncbi:MAG: hypothetical protein GF411_11490 [Candidatus Lokiarchaeota archaeon]|nr:hypothetical protein [Candidatus Lokiarchaeota archaeon]